MATLLLPTPTPTFTSTPTATVTPTPTLTPTPTPTIATKPYSDKYGGFSVNYPIGWMVVEETPGDTVLIAESAAVSDDLAQGAFLFAVMSRDVTSLDELEQELRDTLVEDGLQVTESEPVTVGGVEGIAMTLKGTPPEATAEVQVHLLLLMNGDVGLAFLFGSPAAAWETNWPVLRFMIDGMAFFEAVAMPTPTPTPSPKITSMTFAPRIDSDGNPLDAMDTFPPGTTEVYCVFEYEGFAGIAEFEAVFYRDGEEDVSGPLELTGEESGHTWVKRYNNDGLPPGEYTLEIYVQDQLLSRSTFTVLGATAVVEDDFSDETSGWSTDETDVSKIWYEDDQLHILIKEGGWTHFSIFKGQPKYTFDDFAIEVQVVATELPDKGGEYGVLVRRNGKDYYRLVISDTGYYRIQKHTAEGWSKLVDWVKSDAVKQGPNVVNQLRVECRDQTLRFYVNGTLVDEIEDASFTSGQVGMAVGSFKDGGGVHVVFDNVAVYELE